MYRSAAASRSTSRASGVSVSFFDSGSTATLYGREARVQAQHGARLAVDLVLVVGREQERHHRAGGAGGRLDDVRHVALVGRLVEVVELLAGVRRRAGVRS